MLEKLIYIYKHSLYSLVCRWRHKVLPWISCSNWCCYENGCTNIFEILLWIPLGIHLKVKLLVILSFLVTTTTVLLRASLVAQMVKRLPAMQETRVRFLGREDPLEKEMAIHSSTLAWKIPWTEEPDRLQSMGSQRVGLSNFTSQCSLVAAAF